MRAQRRPQSGSQRGIGLIEVMIALTIGLVLLIGVGQYFVGMRKTSASAQQMSALQNQQRMAMYFLHVAVAGAGYNNDPVNITSDVLYPAVSGKFLVSQTLAGAVVSGNDTLSVRFAASNSGAEQGCSANLTAGDTYTDVFSVDTTAGALTCVETNSTGVVTSVNLITGVTGMQIKYGVDPQNGGSVSQYLNATDVTAGTLWGNVKTVQVTLTFTNPLAGQPGQTSVVPYVMETIPYMANI